MVTEYDKRNYLILCIRTYLDYFISSGSAHIFVLSVDNFFQKNAGSTRKKKKKIRYYQKLSQKYFQEVM